MATFALGTYDGPAVTLPGRPSHRSSPSTPRHLIARRNAIWLRAIEKGLYDPAAGCDRVYHPTELAPLFNVCRRTVEMGIASARRLRDAYDRACDAIDRSCA